MGASEKYNISPSFEEFPEMHESDAWFLFEKYTPKPNLLSGLFLSHPEEPPDKCGLDSCSSKFEEHPC